MLIPFPFIHPSTQKSRHVKYYSRNTASHHWTLSVTASQLHFDMINKENDILPTKNVHRKAKVHFHYLPCLWRLKRNWHWNHSRPQKDVGKAAHEGESLSLRGITKNKLSCHKYTNLQSVQWHLQTNVMFIFIFEKRTLGRRLRQNSGLYIERALHFVFTLLVQYQQNTYFMHIVHFNISTNIYFMHISLGKININ